MQIDKIKETIRELNKADREELYLWMAGQDDIDNASSRSLTEHELAVLIKVREHELDGLPTTVDVLAAELEITRDALIARIGRLNSKAYARHLYLVPVRSSSNTTSYSTVYDGIVRQPATAMLALLFDYNPGLGAANPQHLEKFAEECGITDINYALHYLIDLRYFEKRGEGFGPAHRLNVEKVYLRWLSSRWPVTCVQDRLEVERCRNIILWRVWEQEDASGQSGSPATTHAALLNSAVASSGHGKAIDLAEHAIRSLVADGSLKESFDVDLASAAYYLNEREDPGHRVVTRPDVAFLLAAIADNMVLRKQRHQITTEEVIFFAVQQGMSVEGTLDALKFCERAGYLTIVWEGGRMTRVWRNERLKSQIGFIRRLAAAHPAHSGEVRLSPSTPE